MALHQGIGFILFALNFLHTLDRIIATVTTFEEYGEELASFPPDAHIVYPVQLYRGRILPDLDTRDPRAKHKYTHYHHTSMQFVLSGRRLKLQLELTRELLSDGPTDVFLTNSNANDEVSAKKVYVERCYYHGHVRRVANSSVALRTCNGLSGVIWLRGESFDIRPLRPAVNSTQHPHVIYKSNSTSLNHLQCGALRYGAWRSYQNLHRAEYLRRLKISKANQKKALVSEMKPLRLGLIFQREMFADFNTSLSSVTNYIVQVVNVIAEFYRDLGIDVTLAHTELRRGLDSSAPWRQALASLLSDWRRVAADGSLHVLQLVVNKDVNEEWDSIAIPDTLCTDRAVGISQVHDAFDVEQLATKIVHSIAHNLGIISKEDSCRSEDSKDCKENPCKQQTGRLNPKLFASCHRRRLNQSVRSGLLGCLLRQPIKGALMQQCGNGVVERGEECDCISEEDCMVSNPCCEPSTCLLKWWATCRDGDCCQNCTIMSHGKRCREAVGECDVPEVCSGHSAQCGADEYVADGSMCSTGHCYQGACHSRLQQCQDIWGEGAVPADNKCYEEFNSMGSFNGHCGKEGAQYRRCAMSDLQCGLLHCSGGQHVPTIAIDTTFSLTTVIVNGVHYQCKILNGVAGTQTAEVGMVRDGISCGNHSHCVGQRCIPVHINCPLVGNNVCSGHGVCTTDSRCFCHPGYTGANCETVVMATSTTTSIVRTTITMTSIATTTSSPSAVNVTVVNTTVVNTSTPAVVENSEIIRSGSTVWLLIVLGGVAGGAMILLGCCTLCYRRQSPLMLADPRKKKKKRLFPALSPSPSKRDDGEDGANRLISFGNMPSYRADKLKKSAKRPSSRASETDSERGARQPVAPPTGLDPPRSILKKGGSTGDVVETTPLTAVIASSDVEKDAGSDNVTDDGCSLLDAQEDEEEEMNDADSCHCEHDEAGIQLPRLSWDTQTEASLDSTGSNIRKLQNLNELLRQIDAQFSNVLQQTGTGEGCKRAGQQVKIDGRNQGKGIKTSGVDGSHSPAGKENQNDIVSSKVKNSSAGTTSPCQTGPNKTGVNRTSPGEMGPKRTDVNRTSPSEMGPKRTGVNRTSPSEMGPKRTDANRTSSSEIGPKRTGVNRTSPSEIGLKGTGVNRSSPSEIGPKSASTSQTSLSESAPKRACASLNEICTNRASNMQRNQSKIGPRRGSPSESGTKLPRPSDIGPKLPGPNQKNSNEIGLSRSCNRLASPRQNSPTEKTSIHTGKVNVTPKCSNQLDRVSANNSFHNNLSPSQTSLTKVTPAHPNATKTSQSTAHVSQTPRRSSGVKAPTPPPRARISAACQPAVLSAVPYRQAKCANSPQRAQLNASGNESADEQAIVIREVARKPNTLSLSQHAPRRLTMSPDDVDV